LSDYVAKIYFYLCHSNGPKIRKNKTMARIRRISPTGAVVEGLCCDDV
jgi:hypothetical protein